MRVNTLLMVLCMAFIAPIFLPSTALATGVPREHWTYVIHSPCEDAHHWAAHGTETMPCWRQIFREALNSPNLPMLVSAKLGDYLEGVQNWPLLHVVMRKRPRLGGGRFDAKDGALDDLHLGPQSGRRGDPTVQGPERCLQQLGQGYVDGVVDREVLPQLPGPGQQHVMGVPDQRQIDEIGQGYRGAAIRDLASDAQSAQDLCHLHIDQMGSMEIGRRCEQTLGQWPADRCLEQ